MDNTLYLFCSALLISTLVWLLNPFGKLYSLLRYLFKLFHDPQTANLADGVRSFDEMPGPKGLPYFGDVINYLKTSEFKEQMTALENDFAKYGPIFKKTIMGKTIVSVKHPTDVETVFKAEGKYPLRPGQSTKIFLEYQKSRNLPQGLVGLKGEQWSRLRKALAPKMLRPKEIRDNLDNFNSVTRDAIEHMVSIRGADMEILDLDKELAKWATESVGTMAFDLRVGLYDDPPNKDTVKMVEATLDVFTLAGKLNRGWESLLLGFVKTPTVKKFYAAQDLSLSIGQSIVDNKIKELNKMAEEGGKFEENQTVPLLTYLIMKGELTPEEINMNSIGMFRAGVETTTSGLLWLLYDLANNSKVQDKVYEEVVSLIGPNGDFTSESFAKLHYLKACVKETMRLHPVASSWPRLLTQDVVLAGYAVPSGVSIYSLDV